MVYRKSTTRVFVHHSALLRGVHKTFVVDFLYTTQDHCITNSIKFVNYIVRNSLECFLNFCSFAIGYIGCFENVASCLRNLTVLDKISGNLKVSN